ncbi:MAG TPA: NAD+ synthase [Anaerolineales bacterium]|jgi:NAD+ synthase|nr:NAD+ synthase [Anaerolineales bacterium]
MKIDLAINTDLARKILTGFLKSEVTRVGFTRAVIGLSGGIDSALSCALAAEALGPENVLALRLPYRASSADSLEDAEKTARCFGVKMGTFEITPMVESLMQRDPKMSNVRKGNLMARARMIALYDQSEAFKGLVIGTSNKTEILLGYSTLWGDMASALNPIGDLYKTQVRQLSAAVGVPDSVINKPPSADLWEGQTDESELGFTYEEVDKLLFLLVDKRYTAQDCLEAGFDKAFVEKVLDRIRRSQFKRMMPPIAKLSNRTIGYDFLYLRDWGT